MSATWVVRHAAVNSEKASQYLQQGWEPFSVGHVSDGRISLEQSAVQLFVRKRMTIDEVEKLSALEQMEAQAQAGKVVQMTKEALIQALKGEARDAVV